jgi:hypothetical protein
MIDTKKIIEAAEKAHQAALVMDKTDDFDEVVVALSDFFRYATKYATIIAMCDEIDRLTELLYGTKRERKGLSIGDVVTLTEEAKQTGNKFIMRIKDGEITDFNRRHPSETFALAHIKQPDGEIFKTNIKWIEALKNPATPENDGEKKKGKKDVQCTS